MSATPLGNVLVIGGCGFLGHHIVKVLLEDSAIGEVHVLSRRPDSNRFSLAHYHAGDISSRKIVEECLARVQPRVVIHAASPDPFEDPPNPSNYYRINVEGTSNLLACATEAPSVVAFVYTSSTTVTLNDSNGECLMATEEAPIYTGPFDYGKDSYYRSKAMADEMVRAANLPTGPPSESLRTGTIRVGPTYGEGDNNMTWMGTELAMKGLGFLQLGDNTGLYDPVYAGNAADIHLALAKALVHGTNTAHKVDGEAFNVTDGMPVPFWDFTRQIFAEAGYPPRQDRIWTIPTSLIYILAICAEWVYWIIFMGRKRPRHLQYQKIEFLCKKRTWSVAKAKDILVWKPRITTREGIRRGTAWAVKKWNEDARQRKWKYPLTKSA